MTPEELKPSENYLLELSLIAGIVLLSQFAFTSQVRRAIKSRDNGKDVWDGSIEKLEAAHINHDKRSEIYNSVENGRLLSTRNHYLDHYNRAGRNGLPIRGNDAALRLIWQRLTEQEKEGLPPPPEE